MSQPAPYTPVHTFLTDSASIPLFPGQALDVEFNDIKTTTDQIRTNLALIQRDDGRIANGSVTYDSLDPALTAGGIYPLSLWATGTKYVINQVIVTGTSLYKCAISHTAGVFATDLLAGDWTLLAVLPIGPQGVQGPSGTSTFTAFGISLGLAVDGPAAQALIGFSPSTTNTLTNKTFDTAATGNSLSINGVAATANTGTGSVVRATSPSLTTPSLGVATATSINGIAITAAAGTLTLNSNTLVVAGAGVSFTISGTAGILSFQGTDTYVGRATTDTLTNKSFTGATSFTLGNGFAVQVRSGNAAQFAGFDFGRTGQDTTFGIAGGANQFFSGTVAGDFGFQTNTGSAWFGGASGAATIKIGVAGALSLPQLASGVLQVDSSNAVTTSTFAANAAIATALTSVGPTGSHTTVQEWLAVKGTGGAARWIPMF